MLTTKINTLSLCLSTIVFILCTIYCESVIHYTDSSEYHHQSCADWIPNDGREKPVHNCSLDPRAMKLQCMGSFNTSVMPKIFRALRNVREIDLCGWHKPTFDPSKAMMYFPKVQYLSISYSNLTDIVNSFPDSFHLQTINISFTSLYTVNNSLFKNVRNLKVLDLRHNKLKYIDAPLILPPGLEQLYLSANSWNCSRSLKWLLSSDKGGVLVDRNLMVCSDSKYQGRNLEIVAYYKKVSKAECQSHPDLRNCSCTVHYIMKGEDGKSLTPIYAVNCSHLNFYKFPSYLPRNTTIFYANNNQISDIKPLRDNEIYRNVVDVHLDNNNIQSIDVLEAGYWLRHFRVLSLRNNQLQKLPVYAIDNALENNLNAVKLQLSQNPWVCDCKFTMRFREILMKYHTIIQDSWNVTCNYTNEDDKVIQARVLSMQRIDVCKLPIDTSILPLDLLNATLASLILFVLAKLGYDYYHYKNYGHLPWIVTKMP